jgi:hypothetical protein
MTETTRRPFQLGSVSHGTLRLQDLLPRFLETLTALGGDIPTDLECPTHIEYLNYPGPDTTACDEDDPFWTSEEAGWDMEALFDALQNSCPPFVYFGSTEGDGSDFGFWPATEALEEADYEDGCHESCDRSYEQCWCPDQQVYVHVNDHGNVTVYDAEHNELWSCV